MSHLLQIDLEFEKSFQRKLFVAFPIYLRIVLFLYINNFVLNNASRYANVNDRSLFLTQYRLTYWAFVGNLILRRVRFCSTYNRILHGVPIFHILDIYLGPNTHDIGINFIIIDNSS